MRIDLSKWALGNRKLVALFISILFLGGLLAYYVMPKLEDPEIVVRQAVVVGIYPGASSHQVELELTDPIEKSIQKVDGIGFLQSYSQELGLRSYGACVDLLVNYYADAARVFSFL